MKTFLLGSVAAVGLLLVAAMQPASAAWVTTTAYRWDPYCGRYVIVSERVWVPDPCPIHRDPHIRHGDSPYRDRYDYRDSYRGRYDYSRDSYRDRYLDDRYSRPVVPYYRR